jgi:HAD superfamily hydrolase (TIGR01509 family)
VSRAGRTIQAVVFDFDGLVLDTETSIYTAWCEAYEAHGCTPLTLEEWSAQVGTIRGLDVVEILRSRATRAVDLEAMHATRMARRDELLAPETVRPGIVRWLQDAERRGLRVAIASSSEHEWVEPHLVRLGVRDHFAHVACRSELVPPKPAPDVYLRACEAIGVAPHDAIAVEDSPHGISAAKAAGLWCVAVPNPITAGLDLGRADVVVSSLADLDLGDAIRQATSSRAPGR